MGTKVAAQQHLKSLVLKNSFIHKHREKYSFSLSTWQRLRNKLVHLGTDPKYGRSQSLFFIFY